MRRTLNERVKHSDWQARERDKDIEPIVLKALLHAEEFGANGLIFSELAKSTKLMAKDLSRVLPDLEKRNLIEQFRPNTVDIFYGLTPQGRRLAHAHPH